MFNQTADGKGEPYVHQIRGADNLIGPPFEILSDKAVKYYEKLKDKEEVKKALAAGVPKAMILTYFYPEVTVEKMSHIGMRYTFNH